ncbi:hypothetical protein T459_20889 [Capsicum annuum]|uniref:Uncharacterized protein n=1 Tax=Capsicum annuum TaxID=4072 RepID=A0A2G2Z5S5_CAPAN|nr:hypothetical protein T459_20889 [Capsicum annuum]
MKKSTQLLALISLFSFLFPCYSSYLSSFFSHYSLNYSFSRFPFQLLSHAMDKNYVFLICNGIFLVLLANTSISEEQQEEKEEEEDKDKEEKVEEDEFLNEFQEDNLPLCIGMRSSYLEITYQEEEVHAHVQCEDHEEVSHELTSDVENSNMTIVEYKQDEATLEDEECSRTYEIIEEDDREENDFLIEEEEEEEEPLNKLSNEELNKKFEEFIRKMKEEIRIEARQQLVLVK